MFEKKLETKGMAAIVGKSRKDLSKTDTSDSVKQSEVNKNQQINKEVSSKKPENLKNTNN
jgi:hypothetical protein